MSAPGSAPRPAPAARPAPAGEEIPDFLRFEPVPGKQRHDGWSYRHQFRFVLALARGAGISEAAQSVGRSRQTAYRLRSRVGAESFAAAWDSAVAFAESVRATARGRGRSASAVETLLVPRHFRGRLIGFVQRDEFRGVIAGLDRLDRLAERIEAPARDPGRRPPAWAGGGPERRQR